MHWLLTVLGTRPQDTCYTLRGKSARAKLAPLALMELLPAEARPSGILALCTPEAKRESYPLLRQTCPAGPAIVSVDVSRGYDQSDVDDYLRVLSEKVRAVQATEVTVDVTHGYRHLAFLTYVGVLYLSALHGLQVRGAYYGLLQGEEPSPFLDLGPLLELPRWIHALQVLDETGSAAPMARLIAAGDHSPKDATGMAGSLEAISAAYASGLPLELGRGAQLFLDRHARPFRRLLRARGLPLHEDLATKLEGLLSPHRLDGQIANAGWKAKSALAPDELERQRRLIDDLLRHGNIATALGLMREWTVSWVLLQANATDREKWLDHRGARPKAERVLGAMAALVRAQDLPDALSDEQRALGEFWSELSNLRNAFHHHGMRKRVLVDDAQVAAALQRVCEYWHAVLSTSPPIPLSFGTPGIGRLLITPIGRLPGVLFSALKATTQEQRIDTCMLICSGETESGIQPAVKEAGYSGRRHCLRFADPYGGLAEIERIIKEARPVLVGAEGVLVNVTGGTTLMGLTAEALAQEARSLARPVRRFGLVDRRPPAEQKEHPYQAAEAFWLDGDKEGPDGTGD